MKNSHKQIIRYLGQFMMMIGLICLCPLVLLIFYPSEYKDSIYFIIPGISAIALGFIITILFKKVVQQKLENHQDSVLVVLIWIITFFICSFPYLLTGDYGFTNSIFETVSGFSTTGLTVSNVGELSHLFLFYRSFTQIIGGIGLILVFTSALSDKHGMRLYTAEGHSDRLMPNLAKSARLIISIYSGYILAGTIAYYICGMNLFDAINHSMSAIATGGFSTKVNGIAGYNSFAIELITIVLMILGLTNLVIHTFLIKGKLKKVFHHCETKFFYGLMLVFVPLMALSIVSKTVNFGEGLRVSLFHFTSGISGTGFEIKPFAELSSAFIFFMIIVMIIGGGIGSTAAGIKQFRVWLLIKSIWWNIKDRCTNKKVVRARYISRYDSVMLVTDKDINDNNTFIGVYIFTIITGTMIFAFYGHSLEASMYEFSAILGTGGLSAGICSPTASPVIMWTGILGMFIGRLEIYILFIAISRGVKAIRRR